MSAKLHVLRLVLYRGYTSSAVPLHAVDARALFAPSSSPFSLPASTLPPGRADFLEPESAEYERATSLLPRQTLPAAPVPWPSLFPHEPPRARARARPCDLVARLVAEDRLRAARTVVGELRALHTPIQHRALYLRAALSALADDAASAPADAKAGFLSWLALCPNRPATRNTPALRAAWEPVLARVLTHAADHAFVAAFLELAGAKGLLPTVMGPVVPLLATLVPPDLSGDAMRRATAAYRQSTAGGQSQSKSNSKRASARAAIVDAQIAGWWNTYARAVFLAGWGELAPPSGVTWDAVTLAFYAGETLAPNAAADDDADADGPSPVKASADADSAAHLAVPGRPDLLARMQAALAARTTIAPRDLAVLLRDLAPFPAARAAFAARFCAARPGRASLTRAEAKYACARMLVLRSRGAHDGALRVFAATFHWLGLPPLGRAIAAPSELRSRAGAGPGAGARRHAPPRAVPDIHAVSAVLPAVLADPSTRLETYHAAYLALVPTLPPALRPVSHTHAAFVHASPKQYAARTVQRILDAGLDPGPAAWAALFAKLVRAGNVPAAMRVIHAMEQGKTMGKAVMVPPSLDMLHKARKLLLPFEHEEEAKVIDALIKRRSETEIKSRALATEPGDEAQEEEQAVAHG
ncbi:hypothetical protein Q5752_000219 [Cryptotrichosporon argae]